MKHGEFLPIANIRLDGGTQPRAALDSGAIEDYYEAMGAGVKFPAVTVFYDGTDYWLADGFHRVKAAFAAGFDAIECDLRQGTLEDAQWYSFSANKSNGLRRTNEDKQRAVKAALVHPQSCKLSDHQVARHVGVDVKTVGNWRGKLTMEIPQSTERTGLDGRTTDVSRIGKTSRAAKSAPPSPGFQRASETRQVRQTASHRPAVAGDTSQLPDQALPMSGRATRSQRIDRLARSTLTFVEATKHFAHLVGWLGETAGEFDEAELLLSKANNAIAAASSEIERKALAADPLNASRLEIQEGSK
ncbi:MAG: hypothetical protein P4K98_09935 [Bryobacteraceae bacterium]|nr:hypothetical protein [Bryobacteraceae bacterium]